MALRIETEKNAAGARTYFVRRYDPIGMLTAGGPLEVFQSDDFAQCRAYVRGYNGSLVSRCGARLEFSSANVAYPLIAEAREAAPLLRSPLRSLPLHSRTRISLLRTENRSRG